MLVYLCYLLSPLNSGLMLIVSLLFFVPDLVLLDRCFDLLVLSWFLIYCWCCLSFWSNLLAQSLFCWYLDLINGSVMFILWAIVLVCYENPTMKFCLVVALSLLNVGWLLCLCWFPVGYLPPYTGCPHLLVFDLLVWLLGCFLLNKNWYYQLTKLLDTIMYATSPVCVGLNDDIICLVGLCVLLTLTLVWLI
jgi:hypothetical protein